MQFAVCQHSHIGGRKVNQDRMGYLYTRESLLLVLADGMGGHLRGEIAATLALHTMATLFRAQATPYVRKPEQFLEQAIAQAHADIGRYARSHGMPDTPRTTIVACLVQHNSAVWAHCGDSRLYWLRRGQLLGRTRDHSQIEYLIAKGLADPAERDTHPDRNKLYNCVGASTQPRAVLSRPASLEPGDVLLLCSDGVWAMLPDAEIAQRLATHTVMQAVPDMVAAAAAFGGSRADNATALAIQWQGAADSLDAAVVSTQLLPEGAVTGGLARLDADPFDEDDIERAIAEINDAIEKSSQILK